MSRIDDLRKEISKLDAEHTQTDQQRSELITQRQEKMLKLRQEILRGPGTGDALLDAIIINYRTTDPSLVEKLRAIETEVTAHANELIMIVERETKQFAFRGPMSPTRPGDFHTVEHPTIGLLNGPTLVMKPFGNDLVAEVRGLLRMSRDPEDRLIGFPTSGYIIEPPVDPRPVVISGNLYPSHDLVMTYRQPIRTHLEDEWSLGSMGGGMLPMHPHPSSGGNQLDIYIGNEAVERQVAEQAVTPLHLWWIRRALGQAVAITPEIQTALSRLTDEYLKNVGDQLKNLATTKKQHGIEKLEEDIQAKLARLKKFDIDLTPELKAELDKHRINLPS